MIWNAQLFVWNYCKYHINTLSKNNNNKLQSDTFSKSNSSIFLFKNERNIILINHNLSGHSLQFNDIFIIKISVSLNRVLGKKDNFLQWGDKALHYVYHGLCWYFNVMHWSTIDLACWQKVQLFFSCTLFHRLRDSTVQLMSMDSEKPLKCA